jgi:hypothetical protein
LKKTLMILVVLVMAAMIATPAMAAVAWVDNFDSYSIGNLAGQSNWVGSSDNHPTQVAVVANSEGGNMILASTPGSSAETVTWTLGTAYTGANNHIVYGCRVKRTGTNTASLLNIWEQSTAGDQARFYIYAGVVGGAMVRAGSNVSTATALPTDTWTNLAFDVNTSTHTADCYMNGVSFGTTTYNGTNLSFVSFEIRGTPSTANSVYVDDMWYGDSLSLMPVPEPSSFMALGMFGLGALGFIKRRRA